MSVSQTILFLALNGASSTHYKATALLENSESSDDPDPAQVARNLPVQ